jgi:ribonuclease HI
MDDSDDDDAELLKAVEEMEQQKNKENKEPIILSCYTDGCCLGNGQKGCYGGYGWVVCQAATFDKNKIIKEAYFGSKDNTTNNRMEMTAVLKAMEWVITLDQYVITMRLHSDSEYTLKYLAHVDTWEKANWKKADNTDVQNKDLWIELRTAYNKCVAKGLNIIFVKVVAHLPNGHQDYDEGNEYADDLANQWSIENVPEAAARRTKTKAAAKKKKAQKRPSSGADSNKKAAKT